MLRLPDDDRDLVLLVAVGALAGGGNLLISVDSVALATLFEAADNVKMVELSSKEIQVVNCHNRRRRRGRYFTQYSNTVSFHPTSEHATVTVLTNRRRFSCKFESNKLFGSEPERK
ncbi:uncharacterized protein [Rutidosis leptorrhynchoides]|uniref:uncharacterized protein n=1 Tax=Rutidosis leptorrhynchoides TaxID=125765 RepID=UPI003A99A5D3